YALSEPTAGSDVAGIRCRAERDGDGWVINGEKRWCGVAKMADCIVLLARTKPPEPERRYLGIDAFLIEKERDRFPAGISGEPIEKIGYHGLTTWNLRFDDLRLPAEAHMRTRLRARRRDGDSSGDGSAFLSAMAGLN